MVSLWAKRSQSGGEILIAFIIVIFVVSLIGCVGCGLCFKFRSYKRKRKAATRDIRLENAKVGQKLTQQQADTLFELYENWECFAKAVESKKTPNLGRNAQAILNIDYFRLQKWAKRLHDVEENAEEKDLHRVLKRLANEIEGHSDIFPLSSDTKRKLREIAQLPDKSVMFVSANHPRLSMV